MSKQIFLRIFQWIFHDFLWIFHDFPWFSMDFSWFSMDFPWFSNGFSIPIFPLGHLPPHFSQGDVAHRLEANGVRVSARIRRRRCCFMGIISPLASGNMQFSFAKSCEFGLRTLQLDYLDWFFTISFLKPSFDLLSTSTSILWFVKTAPFLRVRATAPLSILRPLTRLEHRWGSWSQ